MTVPVKLQPYMNNKKIIEVPTKFRKVEALRFKK